MRYNLIRTIDNISIYIAVPAMNFVGGEININANYGVFFKLQNNNTQAAEVAMYASTDSAAYYNNFFANTTCTIEAGESVFFDYSIPILNFINQQGMGSPLQAYIYFGFEITFQSIFTRGQIQTRIANFDNVSVAAEQLPPTRLRVLDGSSIYFGWINRHGGTDNVITKQKNGQTTTTRLGLMNMASVQAAAVKLNAFFVNSAQINVEHVIDCNNVLQLKWLSKRDGVHKSYAFDIVSVNTTPDEKLKIYEQGLSKQLMKEKKVYALRLTEATFADYQYICDLNYSNDINAYILTNASSGSWEAVQRVFITSAIGAFKPNEKRNIEFAVEVESEVSQW